MRRKPGSNENRLDRTMNRVENRFGPATAALTGSSGTIADPWQTGPATRTVREECLESNEALEHFLASIERRAFRLAQFATGNRDEALDIVQDAMLALVSRYGRRPAQEWAPLFHRILQSRIQDWYRRRRTQNRWLAWLGSDDDHDEDRLAALPDPDARRAEDLLGNTRAGAALETALGALPRRQQQAFLLRVWEGLDVAATAAAMGCSEGSVKTHYSRAVHTLREQLEDHWP